MLNRREIRDILISWLTVSFAFAWIGLSLFSPAGLVEFIFRFFITAIAVGTGFICHELAHKYTAIRYGAKAEYHAWLSGLVLALFLAFITNGSMVFAAPGAVYVLGSHISRRENGIISLAGPLANVFVALIFFVFLLTTKGILAFISQWVMQVNIFLAVFNLIPIFPLDGSKVFVWNPAVWAAVFFPLVYVLFFGFPALSA